MAHVLVPLGRGTEQLLRRVVRVLTGQLGDHDGLAAAWTDNGFTEPSALDSAWDRLADYMNAALSPFSVRINVAWPEPGRPNAGWHRPGVTAYSAMMLQIANDIADGTDWKVCENEPCGRLFGRQQGRSVAGQNRSFGVMYCTASCGTAQASRTLRRRKAAQRKE
jgi:hypothetical protein